jgi:hypothetical protein
MNRGVFDVTYAIKVQIRAVGAQNAITSKNAVDFFIFRDIISSLS